jgi:dipeptidyl aminopeptidase/acylaminoacyl peptidase
VILRTRFKRQIAAEFLPPARRGRKQQVIILCDGMPSIPRKQPLMEFLAQKGYWVFYPRYRGAWESGGEFLERSPHLDVLDVIDGLPRGFRELAFGQRFKVSPDAAFVIGGSFGGPAAILASLDRRVTRAIANCPVVDWAILPEAEKAETSNSSYVAYIRESFGNAYRLSERNWRKLRNGKFYNPAFHADRLDPAKIMMFHAKDDPNVPYRSVKDFAERTRVKLNALERGGHVSTDFIVRKYWKRIESFFAS